MKPIRRALISVSDKTGLLPFAQFLHQQKVEILSTGGTLKALKDAGIPAVAVDSFTGFPEILEGRVKTLHPKIHGGLLFRRDKQNHVDQAAEHGIEPIDLVVVNLYPFEKVTAQADVDDETAIENIDIGGPSMLRSAAKNCESVTVICDPADYEAVMEEMKTQKGSTSHALKKKLAIKVFARTASYDGAIYRFFHNRATASEETASALPAHLELHYEKKWDLRYGENPHQPAAFYTAKGRNPIHGSKGVTWNQLHGKELSYNNLLDTEGTLDVINEFEKPAACVIKHSNPCGIAEGKDTKEAMAYAIESDPLSAFGGIIGINRPCDLKTAEEAFSRLGFFEVFVAPSFEPDALEFMKKRPNLRLIETGKLGPGLDYEFRYLQSGLLLQARDLPLRLRMEDIKKNLKTVTQKKLSGEEIEDLLFAFKCVKTVKSNAIVITQGRRTVGIGAGQMSRVDSVEIACRKAEAKKLAAGGILASDAFFPMPDSIEVAHQHKIKAIIQPGGSIKDADVIAVCDKFGIAMVLTGERHFKH